MSPSVHFISNVPPSGISPHILSPPFSPLHLPHSITLPPSPFPTYFSLPYSIKRSLLALFSVTLSLSTQLRAYRFTSFFPIWRQQLLLNALSNSERNSVVLPLSMSLALRLFTVTIHLWTYQRTSNLFLLHNCQAKLHGVCTCVCEQLEGRCESDTGSTSPDVDHCLL